MIEPYKMIGINVIAFLLVVVGLFVYKYYYPKKNINFLFIIILLSLLPLISLLRGGTYESGDMSINVYKSMAFYQNLQEGNFLPRWAGDLNATYGYPLYIFTYPLPYYIISFFHFIGFSFIASIKLLIAVSFITSGIAMYLWTKEEFGKWSALVASIFYMYAPYHLVDMHFRISIGEIVAFALLPLLLFFVNKIIHKQQLKWFLGMTISVALLLLCNPAISVIALPFVTLYAVFTWILKKKKKLSELWTFFFSLVIGMLLTTFYWLPVLGESKYTHQSLYAESLTFVNLPELLYSPWRYGLLFQGPKGELSFLIGYVQLLIVLLLGYFIVKKILPTQLNIKAIFYLSAFIFLCLLMIPLSKPVWENISVLHNFQFTYRLLLFVSLITSILAGIIALKINKKLVILLCLLAIMQTILNWGNRRTIPEITDNILRIELPLSTYAGEGFQPATPKWVNPNSPWGKEVPDKHIEIIKGKASVKELKRTSTEHHYIIKVLEDSSFKENTLYFPNWKLFANDKEIPINYENKKYPGIINFQLKKGVYKLVVNYTITSLQQKSNTISFVTFIGLLFFVMVSYLKKFIGK